MPSKKVRINFGDRTTDATPLFYLAKELGCLPEIIGREYEVKDKEGNLLYLIRQKPMTIPQMQVLLEELNDHNRREERQMRKAKNRGKR